MSADHEMGNTKRLRYRVDTTAGLRKRRIWVLRGDTLQTHCVFSVLAAARHQVKIHKKREQHKHLMKALRGPCKDMMQG